MLSNVLFVGNSIYHSVDIPPLTLYLIMLYSLVLSLAAASTLTSSSVTQEPSQWVVSSVILNVPSTNTNITPMAECFRTKHLH